MKKNKNYFFLLVVLCLPFASSSCRVKHTTKSGSQESVWASISASELKQSKDSLPKKFIAFKLDEKELRKKLTLDSAHLTTILDLPMPDSTFVAYSLIEVQVMAPALAAKYPKFKTYEGVELNNSANRVRIDFNDKNLHAYFMTLKGEFFIAPVDADEKNYYMVFKKEDSPFPKMHFERK